MKIISLINNKGGVAKTTTTHNLGCALAKLGKKIALIDLDPQASLTGRFPSDIVESGKDLLSFVRQDKPFLFENFTQTNIENVWIIPNLKNYNDDVFNHKFGTDQFFVVNDLLANLTNEFDFILIDTPPLIGKLSQNALVVSDYLIFPIKFDIDSVEGIEATMLYFESWKRRQKIKAEVLGILPTYVRQVAMNNLVVSELKNKGINYRIFNNSIPIAVSYDEAKVARKPVFEYDKTKTHYIELAKEILNYV